MRKQISGPGCPSPRGQKSCGILYILNIFMLIIAAVRIFGGEPEAVGTEGGILAEPAAVVQTVSLSENGGVEGCGSPVIPEGWA